MITDIISIVIVLIALFYLFLNLSPEHVKLNLKAAAAFFMVSLLITFFIALVRSLEADYISLMLLQGGITSILFGIGYGICVGLLVHGCKVLVLKAFKGLKPLPNPETEDHT